MAMGYIHVTNEFSRAIVAHPKVLLAVPKVRQATGYTCGVACVQALLWMTGEDFREDRLAALLDSQPRIGTAVQSIISFLNTRDGYHAAVAHEMTLDELIAHIDANHPVVCRLQAWHYEEEPFDYSDSWGDGHYVIAVGYDDERLYFMDPCTLGNYAFVKRSHFSDRWHDRDAEHVYIRVGIVVKIEQPLWNPDAYLEMR